MAVTEATSRRNGEAPAADLLARPTFGVTLLAAQGSVAAGPRPTRWLHVSARELETSWDGGSAQRTVDMRFPDGKLFMAVERDERLGYMVKTPRFGRHIVARDGRTITSALPHIASWRWERPFLAQVLPLAAVLQGLEVFHASAVALRDRAIAFVGTSGVGKTSTAAHLLARGAEFVTDDVLALELTRDGVLAYPGAARLAIDAGEVRRIEVDARPRLGSLLGTFEKRQFAPPPVDGPRTLAHIYFLQHGPSATRATVTEVDEPRRLLGAPFIPHVRSAARLVRHLDVCAQLARSARTFVVEVPPGCQADEVADLTLSHAEGELP
jgi:hypothetical protein